MTEHKLAGALRRWFVGKADAAPLPSAVPATREFSVVEYYDDDRCAYVERWLDAERSGVRRCPLKCRVFGVKQKSCARPELYRFWTDLNAALKSASLDSTIRPFLWSGANSVHARDCAARELSDQLRKDLQDDPAARAVIIAHSHGGNVALRALQHLNSMAGQIRVVTLATPFLRVFARRSFRPTEMVYGMVGTGMAVILMVLQWKIMSAAGLPDILGALHELLASGRPMDEGWWFLLTLVMGFVGGYFIGNWLLEIYTNKKAALAIEEEATYETKGAAASRMLVIRGVDDEASLALAAGSIGAHFGYFVLDGVIPALVLFLSFAPLAVLLLDPYGNHTLASVMLFGTLICAPIFLFLPGVIKSFFFGREFLVNWLVCDIAVDSVPDTSGQVEAITLIPVESDSWRSVMFGLEVELPPRDLDRQEITIGGESEWMRLSRRVLQAAETKLFDEWEAPKQGGHRRLKQLRHGIYNHPQCVDEISRWLRRVI